MFEDPIVSEIRKLREDYAASLGFDLGKIVADLQSRQGKDGRQVIDRTSQNKPEQSGPLDPQSLVNQGVGVLIGNPS